MTGSTISWMLDLAQPVGSVEGPLQIWGRARACSREIRAGSLNPTRHTRSVRPCVEALSLRRWLREEGVSFSGRSTSQSDNPTIPIPGSGLRKDRYIRPLNLPEGDLEH